MGALLSLERPASQVGWLFSWISPTWGPWGLRVGSGVGRKVTWAASALRLFSLTFATGNCKHLLARRPESCAIRQLCLPFRGAFSVRERTSGCFSAFARVEEARVIGAHMPSVFLTAGP